MPIRVLSGNGDKSLLGLQKMTIGIQTQSMLLVTSTCICSDLLGLVGSVETGVGLLPGSAAEGASTQARYSASLRV